MGRLQVSCGIWALGPMITRFVPGGYQPRYANESMADKVHRAVDGLGDLVDGYEFHYPQEISEDSADEILEALDDHDVYCLASGLHLDPIFGKGGFCSPDDRVRKEAVDRTKRGIDLARDLGANFIIWPGVEGYNYPFQSDYSSAWSRFVDGLGQVAGHATNLGVTILLEHKNSEPAMKILMRNVGMCLYIILKLREQGLNNLSINMDWQHLIMNGENLAEYAALLASEGLLGHHHANSGWGTFDDDNMTGALNFMETLELAIELRAIGYGQNGERLGFDLYPYTEDQVGAIKRSVLQWDFIDGIAGRIDAVALRAARRNKDAITAYEIVYAALGA